MKFYQWRELAYKPYVTDGFKAPGGVYFYDAKQIDRFLGGIAKSYAEKLRAEIKAAEAELPAVYPFLHVVKDIDNPGDTNVELRGDPKTLGEVAPRRFLQALCTDEPEPYKQGSGRAQLADAIVKHPLTARVIVNRVWQHHFGKGIVRTPSNFGRMGERPTHPELLDTLAARFIANGWSLKKLHRLILTSKAYQQSADYNPKAAKADSENRLLWRFRRQRMTGEVLRDTLLSVSGELSLQRGGESVMPPLPADVTTRGYWKDSTNPKESNRRSIYIFVKRNLRFPLFEAFDMPDTHEACARRQVTITPLQSLLLMNEATMLQTARTFAERVLRETENDPKAQIERAYQLAFQRSPDVDEHYRALRFLTKQAEIAEQRLQANEKIFVPQTLPQGVNKAQGAALIDFCHVLMNTNEFVYVE